MKKQLLIAAVAATMSVAATADISIKGDAHLRYANIDQDAGALGGAIAASNSNNTTGQRVRLHLTGKSGDSVVKLGLRNDGGTRVSNGDRTSEGSSATGSGTGLGSTNNAALNVDYLYVTTKIGALNIKAGDWWDTTGLGVARKGTRDADRVEFSTKVGGWKLGVETGAGSSSTVLSASGKIAGFTTKVEHDTGATGGSTTGNTVGDYTDVSVKGKAGAVGIAVEYFAGDVDNSTADADASVIHLWTKASDITWHVAYAKTDAGVSTLNGSNSKFSPLGVSILGSAPGINGKLAIGNFNSTNGGLTTGESDVFGIRADMKVAGMGLQVAAGNLELQCATGGGCAAGTTSIDDTFWDVIATRPLGKGSNIKFSVGSFADVTSAGAKISVKF